jgi:hypothetical protein
LAIAHVDEWPFHHHVVGVSYKPWCADAVLLSHRPEPGILHPPRSPGDTVGTLF